MTKMCHFTDTKYQYIAP